MKRSGGFTLVDTEVLLAIALLVIVFICALPRISDRGGVRVRRTGAALAGIHRCLVLYGQTNSGYYPGLDSSGRDLDTSVGGRLLPLLSQKYIAGELVINDEELRKKSVWTDGVNSLSTANYSYALLQVPATGQRRSEWRDTANGKAAIGSDRAITVRRGGLRSLYTKPDAGKNNWEGYIAWNDNHVTFERPVIAHTQYGTSQHNADDLFKAVSDDDAYMIYEGK